MGAYTSFTINGYEIFEDKNDYSEKIMILFREEMKAIEQEFIDDTIQKNIYYRMSSKDLGLRLNIMGYTYERASKDFYSTFDKEEYFEYLEEEFRPNEVDLNFFLRKLKFMIQHRLYFWDLCEPYAALEEIELGENNIRLLEFIFRDKVEEDGYLLGIPLSDSLNLLQLILGISDYNGDVEYNLTDIIMSGYFEEDYEFVNNARLSIAESYYTYGNIIVITEGTTDKFILEKALETLYPNQSDIYTFFDYKSSNAPGSTNEMVKVIKSFIASKIINKTIVIFDNDTAGKEAIELLSDVRIPNNIKIMTYPDIDICNNYPTIGPQGVQNMNINGLAASIELYLGSNVLTDDEGYIPIQWMGYRDKIKQYQGQVLKKEHIQRKFMELLKTNPETIEWESLNKILTKMFLTFS